MAPPSDDEHGDLGDEEDEEDNGIPPGMGDEEDMEEDMEVG